MPDRRDQPPEGELIQLAVDRERLSVRALAPAAGISEARWRQIVNGYQSAGRGERIPVVAPAQTLARMAKAVGVNAGQLRGVGRTDAAEEFERLFPDERTRPSPAEVAESLIAVAQASNEDEFAEHMTVLLRRIGDPDVADQEKFMIRETIKGLAIRPAQQQGQRGAG